MTERSARLGYLPGVDGLRAVSVLAVFLFHAGVLDGGFIGVDVFFVISGYLITALAITEIERTGRLGLGTFWARRARRLLPALMLVCAAVLVYSIVEGGAALRRVGRDITATMLYVANWAQIGDGRDYFASYDAPPLLQHAWSLAVEEQFYLAWPLILAAVVMAIRNRPGWLRPTVAAIALAAAVASVGISLWLRSSDASLSRLYFGTDTRAVGLAVGSIAGCYLRPAQVTAKSSRQLDALGVAGAATLAALMLGIDGSEGWLYGPGFLVIALASLAMMAAAMGAGVVGRVMSLGPLVALGRVSYGFYLWHWPVIVVLDSDRTGLSGLPIGALWLSVTAALTAASWFVVEQRAPLPTGVQPQRALAYLSVGAVLVVGGLVATRVENERFQSADFTVPATLGTTIAPPDSSRPSVSVPVLTETAPPPDLDETTTTIAATTTSTFPATTTTLASEPLLPLPSGRPLRVMVIGDSVAMSLATEMTETHDVEGYGQVEVLNVGNLACPVIEEGEWWFAEGIDLDVPDECVGPDRYEPEIDEFQPDVVYALFGWTGGGGGQRLPDGTEVAPCQPEFDDRWLTGYQNLVDRLGQRTIVVISTVAPADIDDEGHDVPTRCLNELVEQLDADVFDYGDWLCPDYDCSPSSDLRADKVHFSDIEPLRRGVTGAILAQVLPIAGY